MFGDGMFDKNSIKSRVYNTEQSFKSGILKNNRKIDIPFDFLALEKGLVDTIDTGTGIFQGSDVSAAGL